MQMYKIYVLKLQPGTRQVSKFMFAGSGRVNHQLATMTMSDVTVYEIPDHDSKYLIKGYFSESKQNGYAWFEADYDVHYGSEADFCTLRAIADPIKWIQARPNRNLTVYSRRDRGVRLAPYRANPELNPQADDINALIAELESPL